jgi:hypothetical protein
MISIPTKLLHAADQSSMVLEGLTFAEKRCFPAYLPEICPHLRANHHENKNTHAMPIPAFREEWHGRAESRRTGAKII